MGLDQYAYIAPAGTDISKTDPESATQIAQWRKHANLQGWMASLWCERNPEMAVDDFNCQLLELMAEDIEQLHTDVTNDKLPETEGFFFGQSNEEDKEDDLRFIWDARAALAQGYKVYYSSWW